MKKKTTAFFCQECGYESAKWVGQCPACKAWNSMVEEPVKITPAGTGLASAAYSGGFSGAGAGRGRTLQPVPLSAVEDVREKRIPTGFAELDRVLGGGIVAGSMILVGGDPGIGKSTLLLQAMAAIGGARKALYVTGEESVEQVALRADRLGLLNAPVAMTAETTWITSQ